MKVFGLLAFLTVLASCNGSSGGGSIPSKGVRIDPVTADKFEEAIRSQTAGMVNINNENGAYVDLTFNEATGKYDSKIAKMNSKDRDTILKIDGDMIYTLEETFEAGKLEPVSRKVKMESMEQLVKDITEPLPPGTTMTNNGVRLTLKFKFSYTNDLSRDGKNVSQTSNTSAVATINLNNIRCSQLTSMTTTSTLTADGVTTKLPTTDSGNSNTCGPTLTSAQLKAIPLTNIELCDETSGDDNAEIKCHTEADLSHLVN